MNFTGQKTFLNNVVLIIGIFAAWQIVFWSVGEDAISSPVTTIRYLFGDLLASPDFWVHLRESGKAFALALTFALVSGLLFGVMLGVSRLASDVATPILVAFYSIPKVTLYPVILLLVGIGMPAKVLFGALHGFFPITIFVMNSIRNLSPVYLKTARVLRMSRHRTVWRVLFPGALPEILSGVRIGFALSMLGTLLGEMFGSQKGIGYLLMGAIGLHNMRLITAIVLLLATFSIAVNALLLMINRRLQGD